MESTEALSVIVEPLAPIMHNAPPCCDLPPASIDSNQTLLMYGGIPEIIITGPDEDSTSSIGDLYSKSKTEVLINVDISEVVDDTATDPLDFCPPLSDEYCRHHPTSAPYWQQMDESSARIAAFAAEVQRQDADQARWNALRGRGTMPCNPKAPIERRLDRQDSCGMESDTDSPLFSTKSIKESPTRVGDRVMENVGISAKNWRPHILIVGLSSERGYSDKPSSLGQDLAIHLLSAYNVYLEYADPLVDESVVPFMPRLEDKNWGIEMLQSFDAILVAGSNPGYNYALLHALEAQGTYVEWLD